MIKIEQLLPALKKGWVVMDPDGCWLWFSHKPTRGKDEWFFPSYGVPTMEVLSVSFNIAPVEDWKKSLIRVTGDNDKELEKTKQQLEVALNGLFEICNNPSPDFNRILYAREVWHKVKELKNDN